MPSEFRSDPLMYQGCSAPFLGPRDPIVAADESWGIDFEAELAVITDDVPVGTKAGAARNHIKLILLVNDVSLRNLIAPELAKGFGFVQSKPPTAAAPVAVTPDELAEAWNETKVHLPLRSFLNGKLFGTPNAGADMNFNFSELIEHAAKTRPLCAGTIIGSGTVSNYDAARGFSCIIEKRLCEIIETGAPSTPFLSLGDRICLEMIDGAESTVFGAINQVVQPA